MLARNDLEKMAQDAKLALSRSYGYPEARVKCAHHVERLVQEVERAQAVLAAAHGDWSEIRKLAG